LTTSFVNKPYLAACVACRRAQSEASERPLQGAVGQTSITSRLYVLLMFFSFSIMLVVLYRHLAIHMMRHRHTAIM